MKSTGNKKVWTTTTTKKVEKKTISSCLNKLLWLVVIVLGAIIIFVSMYLPILKDSSSLTAAFVIVGIVIMLAVARLTNEGIKGLQFILDARLEIRKIVWPTKQETINSTLIVFAITIFTSLIIYFMGLLFMNLIQWILT